MIRPSVVCLSSVTIVAPEAYLNLSVTFLHHQADGTRTVCIKILGINSKGFLGIVQVKYQKVWKDIVFDQYLALIWKRYKIRP